MKKGGLDLFDEAMAAYDGAEVCELVGTFSATLQQRLKVMSSVKYLSQYSHWGPRFGLRG